MFWFHLYTHTYKNTHAHTHTGLFKMNLQSPVFWDLKWWWVPTCGRCTSRDWSNPGWRWDPVPLAFLGFLISLSWEACAPCHTHNKLLEAMTISLPSPSPPSPPASKPGVWTPVSDSAYCGGVEHWLQQTGLAWRLHGWLACGLPWTHRCLVSGLNSAEKWGLFTSPNILCPHSISSNLWLQPITFFASQLSRLEASKDRGLYSHVW